MNNVNILHLPQEILLNIVAQLRGIFAALALGLASKALCGRLMGRVRAKQLAILNDEAIREMWLPNNFSKYEVYDIREMDRDAVPFITGLPLVRSRRYAAAYMNDINLMEYIMKMHPPQSSDWKGYSLYSGGCIPNLCTFAMKYNLVETLHYLCDKPNARMAAKYISHENIDFVINVLVEGGGYIFNSNIRYILSYIDDADLLRKLGEKLIEYKCAKLVDWIPSTTFESKMIFDYRTISTFANIKLPILRYLHSIEHLELTPDLYFNYNMNRKHFEYLIEIGAPLPEKHDYFSEEMMSLFAKYGVERKDTIGTEVYKYNMHGNVSAIPRLLEHGVTMNDTTAYLMFYILKKMRNFITVWKSARHDIGGYGQIINYLIRYGSAKPIRYAFNVSRAGLPITDRHVALCDKQENPYLHAWLSARIGTSNSREYAKISGSKKYNNGKNNRRGRSICGTNNISNVHDDII